MEPGKRRDVRAHMPEAATDWLNPLAAYYNRPISSVMFNPKYCKKRNILTEKWDGTRKAIDISR